MLAKKHFWFATKKFVPKFMKPLLIEESYMEGTKGEDYVILRNLYVLSIAPYVLSISLALLFIPLALFGKIPLPMYIMFALGVSLMSVFTMISIKIESVKRKISKNQINLTEKGIAVKIKWYDLAVPLFVGFCLFLVLFNIGYGSN